MISKALPTPKANRKKVHPLNRNLKLNLTVSSKVTKTLKAFLAPRAYQRKVPKKVSHPHRNRNRKPNLKCLEESLHLPKPIDKDPELKPRRYFPLPTLILKFPSSTNRHAKALISSHLMSSNDIESNPGPTPEETSLTVTNYNVRGLGDERKMRHLVNSLYKGDKGKNVDNIICLQETFITSLGKLPYLWRGNLHHTPGTGSSCGCITLTSSHLNIIHSINLENRAHVIVCQKSGEVSVSYIVANIYAPNANSSVKLEFFASVFEAVMELSERYDCLNILLAGDFNLILDAKEAKNRAHTAQEKRIASYVKDQMRTLELNDCWETKKLFTWRRPNSDIFSTIDRQFFSRNKLILKNIDTIWSLGYSDHAAVVSNYVHKNKTLLPRSKITRLDPSLTKSPRYSSEIEDGFVTMLSTMPQEWNPHLKLEFAKVCIRTVVEKVQADRKSNEIGEEALLNDELELSINKLATGDLIGANSLLDHVEDLRARKQILIEEKGARLAEKLGTKWFNEGEKSSRYFLRLLNRTLPDNFEVIQNEMGEIVNDPKEVEAAIVDFYKNLYEAEDLTVNNDDQEFFNELDPISDIDDVNVAALPTADDLLATLKTCNDSAPGPDGIPYSILKLLWPTYGELLRNAWEYSLSIRSLPPSHKLSFLKLIPKAGKDPKRLTNWRPITLSNCDHKLITKTYSIRLCEKVASRIGGRQTAYLKGRIINDNIRSVLSSINLSNMEANLKGVIVSLDAKKAFDSVSHSYIEECLKRFGCHSFIPIFRTLYKDLKTDIIINGRIVPGFLVKRGVKQGDALSCILFIMCIEPLLRNIDKNPAIEALRSNLLNSELPKAYAYADDVNCITTDKLTSIQALFDEYERLTKMSGLELNADKTELIRLGSEEAAVYNVTYKDKAHAIKSQDEIKINGIFFQRDLAATRERNVSAVIQRMDSHFRNWSRRSLSTLGKIVITKTFGISQLIYLLQSITLNDADFKKINAVLYKFIWNRRYLAAKAPERVKRAITTNSIYNGGLGMLDVVELDESLKIKALSRILKTNHPFLKILKEKLDLSTYFLPSTVVPKNIDQVFDKGIDLLRKDRDQTWAMEALNNDRNYLAAIRALSLRTVVDRRGQGGIHFFRLWARGARKVGDLAPLDLNSIRRHLIPSQWDKLNRAVAVDPGPPSPEFSASYFTGTKHKPIESITSKEFRNIRSKRELILEFKLGLSLTPLESKNWGRRLNRLTSTRHKNSILKALHGDVYTMDRLHRFGLKDTDRCPRCNEKEDLEHKILSCEYTALIWDHAIPFIRKLNTLNDPQTERLKLITASAKDSSLAAMTLTAELIQTILQLKQDQTYLVHPKFLVRRAIKNICVREGKREIKESFIELMDEAE